MTSYSEGDTEITLKDDSDTGHFYEEAVDTEPIMKTLVRKDQTQTMFFYEDNVAALNLLNLSLTYRLVQDLLMALMTLKFILIGRTISIRNVLLLIHK